MQRFYPGMLIEAGWHFRKEQHFCRQRKDARSVFRPASNNRLPHCQRRHDHHRTLPIRQNRRRSSGFVFDGEDHRRIADRHCTGSLIIPPCRVSIRDMRQLIWKENLLQRTRFLHRRALCIVGEFGRGRNVPGVRLARTRGGSHKRQFFNTNREDAR